MQTQQFYRNRSRALAVTLLFSVFLILVVGFAVWAFANPEGYVEAVENAMTFRHPPQVALPISLILAPGFLGLAVYHGRRALDRRPLLVLSDDGLFYRDWRAGVIPWQEVMNCIVVVRERGRERVFGWQPRDYFLELHLRHPRPYLEKVHGPAEFTEDYQRRYFRIPMRDLHAGREEVRRAIMARAR